MKILKYVLLFVTLLGITSCAREKNVTNSERLSFSQELYAPKDTQKISFVLSIPEIIKTRDEVENTDRFPNNRLTQIKYRRELRQFHLISNSTEGIFSTAKTIIHGQNIPEKDPETKNEPPNNTFIKVLLAIDIVIFGLLLVQSIVSGVIIPLFIFSLLVLLLLAGIKILTAIGIDNLEMNQQNERILTRYKKIVQIGQLILLLAIIGLIVISFVTVLSIIPSTIFTDAILYALGIIGFSALILWLIGIILIFIKMLINVSQ